MRKNLSFLLLAVLLMSCQKQSNLDSVRVNQSPIVDINAMTIEDGNDLIVSYSKLLAHAVSNPEVRSIIKVGVEKKFDGDYDLLINDFMGCKLTNCQQSISDYLREDWSSTKSFESNVVTDVDELLSIIQQKYPTLQVSVPVNCDNWDVQNYVPLVAYLPLDYDEDTYTEIEAFDSMGASYMLSLDIEPDFPVIVVSLSERVDESESSLVGKQSSDIVMNSAPAVPSDINLIHAGPCQLEIEWHDTDTETSYELYRKQGGGSYELLTTLPQNVNYYLDDAVEPMSFYSYRVRALNSDGSSAYTDVISTYASDRENGEELSISGLFFTNDALKKVEKWASGAPEIRLRVVTGTANSAINIFTSGILEPEKRADINGQWWGKKIQICQWDPRSLGTILTFDWREEDWDDNVTFTITPKIEIKSGTWSINLSAFSLTYTGDEGGDVIGNTIVQWWEPTTKVYDLTGFRWKF